MKQHYYVVACWNTASESHWIEEPTREDAIATQQLEMNECAKGYQCGVYMSHREMSGWQKCWSPGIPATPTGTWIVPMEEKK